MGLNATNFAALLKELFFEDEIARLTYTENRLLALLPKKTKFGGSDVKIPLIYGNPQSIGPFSNAQTQKSTSNTQSQAFTLTRRKKYGVITIDGETILASEGDDAAFMEARKTEIEGIFESVSRDLALDLYRDGTGALGTVASGQGTPTVTLTNKADARNFEIGMWVNGIHAGAVIGAPDKVQITKVDTGAGTLTITGANWNAGIGGLVATDSLCRDGCFTTSGSTASGLACMEGLGSYLPLTAPNNTLFYGVDRSKHPTRLGGVRLPLVAGKPIEEIFIDLITAVAAEGGSPDTCFISVENYGELIKALGAKKTYGMESTKRYALRADGTKMDGSNGMAEIGFSGVKVLGAGREVDVIPDNCCPPDRMFALTMKDFAVRTIGQCPTMLDLDGKGILREAASDGYEVRIGYYGNLECRGPGRSGVAPIG